MGVSGGLLHEESGTFVWQRVARPAERTPRFLPGPVPGTADVRFADGRPFHDLDLTSGRRTTSARPSVRCERSDGVRRQSGGSTGPRGR